MADGNIEDDNYVANLLKQDAKNTAKKYELVGIDAFNPKRLRSGAPKPNTNFLRHIIRQTDNHNAALLAKEAEESRARLREMNKGKGKDTRREHERQSRGTGRLTPPLLSDDDERPSKRRRSSYNEDEDERDGRRRRKHRDEPRDSRSVRERDRNRHERKEKRVFDEDSEDERSRRKSKHSRHQHAKDRRHRHRHRQNSEEEVDRSRRHERSSHKHRRRRSQARSNSRTRSPSPRTGRHHRSSKNRQRSRSPRRSPSSPGQRNDGLETTDKRRKRSISLGSDSDPLEAIVGPLPPPAQPAVRSRGRGAHKANSMGINSRFSSTYDPVTDVQPNSDAEDDWGDAVEAFRDRQKWKQQGAERLKAAGFTDDQVKKWEKGDEKDEDDVVWAAKGQAREWDRGKVVDEEGDVDLKADWGRLK